VLAAQLAVPGAGAPARITLGGGWLPASSKPVTIDMLARPEVKFPSTRYQLPVLPVPQPAAGEPVRPPHVRNTMTSRPRLRAVLAAGAVCALAVTGISACSRGPARTFMAAPNTVTGTKPPPLTVLTHDTGGGSGDIFIAPAGGGYPAGPEILTTTGKVVWFHRLPAGDVATDFRTQTYLGHPVLTWFQSGGQGAHGGPGGAAGPASQQVIDGLVQEIDIKTGRVLFQWDSASHVPYADSYAPLPSSPSTPWDWFHINAVHLDTDGNLLVDSRNTWTMFKVNRRTGQVMWRLGGKHSSFTLRAAPGQVLDHAGKIFAWQHDPEGQWADHTGRRPVRRLGLAALHLRVQPGRQAAVQCQAAGRGQHVPRLPAALASG